MHIKTAHVVARHSLSGAVCTGTGSQDWSLPAVFLTLPGGLQALSESGNEENIDEDDIEL